MIVPRCEEEGEKHVEAVRSTRSARPRTATGASRAWLAKFVVLFPSLSLSGCSNVVRHVSIGLYVTLISMDIHQCDSVSTCAAETVFSSSPQAHTANLRVDILAKTHTRCCVTLREVPVALPRHRRSLHTGPAHAKSVTRTLSASRHQLAEEEGEDDGI